MHQGVALHIGSIMLSLWVGAILLLGYFVVHGVISPVSKVPGPLYTRFTSLWIKFQEFTANRRESVHRLHQIYGPVVRLGPNEVSFTSLDAIREIYASGGSGYDKTEFYSLFKQMNTRRVVAQNPFYYSCLTIQYRTMFSTLEKDEVSRFWRVFARKSLISRYAA